MKLTRKRSRPTIAFLVFNLDGMGGTSRSAITQANALSRLGRYDVRLVSVTRSADAPHYTIDGDVTVTYLCDVRRDDPRHRQPSRLVPQRWDGQFSALTDGGMTALRDLEVDLVVTVTPALMASAVQLLPVGTAILHQEHRSSADRAGGMEPLLAFAPRVDAVAMLTESMADWLSGELGAAAPPIVVMPNPLPVSEQARSPLDSRRIVTAGRIVEEKQFIHLIRAFEEVADELPGWTVRILGDGPLREELIAHAAKAGLADRVELPGTVDDMAPEWARAAICALSSKTEGFPLVAQEAMSAGVPVVSYDCPSGPRELITHGTSGLLVGAGAKAGLAAALHSLATDPELLRRLGQGALDASRAYEAGTIAARWAGIIDEVLAHRGTAHEPTKRRPFTREQVPGSVPLVTPAEARSEALRLCIEAAAATGDDWFVIPTHDRPAPTVVVPASARARMLTALSSAPEHFSLVHPHDRGWPARRLPPRRMAEVLSNAAPNRVVLEPWPRGEGRRSHLAEDSGVDIEFWDRLPTGALAAPRPNRWLQRVSAATPRVEVEVAGLRVPTLELMAAPTAYDVAFPIDVVYTWVDDGDPSWLAARDERSAIDARREAAGDARFRNRDELRYSMRSLHMFAPWVRRIHLVTAGQRPEWLTDHPQVSVVDHRDILPADALPTFNSQAIETALHRIPGLAEHFVYMNDDVFLGRPTRPELFFSPGGQFGAFVGDGAVGLPEADAKPFLQAAANNRALIREAFGVEVTNVMSHSPHPHRVSVLTELSTRFADAVERTARSPFRSPADVSMLSSLAQHYGLASGAAYVAHAEHAFVDLSNARVERHLRQLRARDKDFFCVGDHHDFAVDMDAVEESLAAFLAAYFPVPAPWE